MAAAAALPAAPTTGELGELVERLLLTEVHTQRMTATLQEQLDACAFGPAQSTKQEIETTKGVWSAAGRALSTPHGLFQDGERTLALLQRLAKDFGKRHDFAEAARFQDAADSLQPVVQSLRARSDVTLLCEAAQRAQLPVPTPQRGAVAPLERPWTRFLLRHPTAAVQALRTLRAGVGVTAQEAKAAGFTPKQVKRAGYTAVEAKGGGFSLPDIKRGGYTAAEAKGAEFTLAELKTVEYTAAEVKEAAFTLEEIRGVGYTASQVKGAGYNLAEIHGAGYTAADVKGAGFTATEAKGVGYTLQAVKSAAYNPRDVKDAGFTLQEMKAEGYTAAEAKVAGFSVVEVKGVRYTLEAAQAGGYTAPSRWQEVTHTAGWAPRNGAAAVVLPSGDVLLIGGEVGGAAGSTDVWRSSDGGVTWTCLTHTPGWGRRAYFGAVVLQNGDVLVVAGNEFGAGDVWKSTDGGVTWALVCGGDPWVHDARWQGGGMEAVVLQNGDVLVMGGRQCKGVWRSSDGGVTWDTLNTEWAMWGHRAVVLHNGDVLVVGGRGHGGYHKAALRSSDRGETWTQVTADTGWYGAYPTVAVLENGDVVAAGGQLWEGTSVPPSGDVWRSSDGGATWTKVSTSPPDEDGWGGRFATASVVLPGGGGLLLMGGCCRYGRRRDVWKTTDGGESWTCVIRRSGWNDRFEASVACLPNGDLMVLGGETSARTAQGWTGVRCNEVWRSSDGGATWVLATAEAGWTKRAQAVSVVLPDGDLVVLGGDDGAPRCDVWRSSDGGVTWVQATAEAEWGARVGFSAGCLANGDLVVMGGELKNDVWKSSDKGETWTEVTPHAEWWTRRDFALAVMPNDAMLVMGGLHNGGKKNDVWRSLDGGATWTEVTACAPWSRRSGLHAVVLHSGDVVVLGGQPQKSAWKSCDGGVTWAHIPFGDPQRFGWAFVVCPTGEVVAMGHDEVFKHHDLDWFLQALVVPDTGAGSAARAGAGGAGAGAGACTPP